MLVLAAKPFGWEVTFALGCWVLAIVVAVCGHYYKQPSIILPGGPPGMVAIPLSSRIAQVHMLIADASLCVAFFRRADNATPDDLWSLTILFGVTQLVLGMAARHDPRTWGLFRMRLWFSGFIVFGGHSSVLSLCGYYMAQILFFFGCWVYFKYFAWRTQPTQAQDYRLWIYCLMGAPMDTLSIEEQNLIVAQSILRAQLAFSVFLVGTGVDIVRGEGSAILGKIIIGSQILLVSGLIAYMVQQRAKQFIRQNAVPQLVNWQPPAAADAAAAGNGDAAANAAPDADAAAAANGDDADAPLGVAAPLPLPIANAEGDHPPMHVAMVVA